MKRSISLIAALLFVVVVGLYHGFSIMRNDAERPDRTGARGGGSSSVTIRPALTFPPHDPDTVLVYFGNTVRDPQFLHCTETYPVERTIPARTDATRFALEQLLAGPTESEQSQGYVTYVPVGVALRDVSVKDNVATVIFSTTQGGPAGQCRSMAYRSQLTYTLKQFPEIRDIRFKVGYPVSASSSSR